MSQTKRLKLNKMVTAFEKMAEVSQQTFGAINLIQDRITALQENALGYQADLKTKVLEEIEKRLPTADFIPYFDSADDNFNSEAKIC